MEQGVTYPRLTLLARKFQENHHCSTIMECIMKVHRRLSPEGGGVVQEAMVEAA